MLWQTVSLTPVWYVEEKMLYCLLELEDEQSHLYQQVSILFSGASRFWHNVGPRLYCPMSRENMEYLCIQIVDPVERLPFSGPHRSISYGLRIWSVPSFVLLGHDFLLKLLNAQLIWKHGNISSYVWSCLWTVSMSYGHIYLNVPEFMSSRIINSTPLF